MEDTKGVIVNNIVSNLKEEGVENIYADIMGFKNPYKIGWKKSDKGYYPDVIGASKKITHIFSVETKLLDKVPKKDLDKWRMFSLYAKANNGNMYLVAFKPSIQIIQRTIKELPTNLKFIEVVI